MIKKIIILTVLLTALVSNSSQAQWKMLFHYPSGYANTPVYFLDLPGPPKIGFIGNEQFGIMKTTDGGQTWNIKLNGGMSLGWPEDIVFKDSLTGWVASDGGIFKTTDCGVTWAYTDIDDYELNNGIYYDKGDEGLFIAGGDDENIYRSWDEGLTFSQPTPGSYENVTSGFCFNNDDTGILATNGYFPWLKTTDGGHTWNQTTFDSGAWQPLAIPGTTTQFAVTSVFGSVLRSDDYWNTWDSLYQFPYRPDIDKSESSGCIRGDTSHLFVQTADGCFMSTDQGHSWNYLCGMPSPIIGETRFYVKYPYVYLQVVDQIWMLNVDSMQYFASEVNEQFPDGSKRNSVSAGSNVTVNYVPHTDTLVGIDSVMLAIHYDSASLSLNKISIPSPWSILDSSLRGNMLYLLLTDTSAEPLPSPILQLQFGTFLTSELSSKVYLDSAHLYGHRLNCDCAVQSILSADTSSLASSIDSVEIDFTGCGDSILIEAMQGKLAFSILSIQPNPASSSIEINLSNPSSSSIDYTLFDALGQTVLTQHSALSTQNLDVMNIPSGIYFIRISQNGFVQSRQVAIER